MIRNAWSRTPPLRRRRGILARRTSEDLEHRCVHKLPTVRGITPVELEGYGVVTFVGPWAIRLRDQPPDALVSDAVRALRGVGTPANADDLPAPPHAVGQVVAHCVIRPRR